MSAGINTNGGDERIGTTILSKFERIVIKMPLAGLGLALGGLAGIVIALSSGLLQISC